MSIVVVGSVAYDTVITPFGRADDTLGGAATFFSVAASYFCPVKAVGVVGDDFSADDVAAFHARGIDTEGIARRPGRSFRWGGEYSRNLNERTTLFTELNVFEEFDPELPSSYRDASHVFLANIAPELQLSVLEQVETPELIALDTMNFWIEGSREALIRVLERVHVLVINDEEARQLADEHNLVKAAESIMGMGPRAVVIKRGEYGATAFLEDGIFAAPAFPLRDLADPTGAGDTFAGGFMGYLCRSGSQDSATMRRAIIAGSVMASFCVEAFSLDGIRELDEARIAERYADFQKLTDFGDL